MKVKDLVKRLLEVDQEAEVITQSGNFELHGALVPVEGIIVVDTAKKVKKTFRDAFDGESFEKEVWQTIGGTEIVVWI